MIHTQSRIVVSEGPCEAHGVAHTCVHHQNFPENWAQGETPAAAARYLLNMFEKELDSVGGDRHREGIIKAMADLREFLAEHQWDAVDEEESR
ncbi:hypothetical protein [Tautonia sociabilis]|uniref:Uncharacterized protein n=1 Tax=Tautonia sociabilis TaxID=2080755 RepID=A0A432MPZ7_9BACT|nr:hypothetical protein [Tautonia sociabilis]RUL89319.1 hypothetical protein TsocGM_02585 [Tautonia sociabilis]